MGTGGRGSPKHWCPKARWVLLSDPLVLPCSHVATVTAGMRDFYPNGSSLWTPLHCCPAVLAACFSGESPSAWPILGGTHSCPSGQSKGRSGVLIPYQCSPGGGGKLLAEEFFLAVVEQQPLAHTAPGIQQGSSRELALTWSLQEHFRYLPWREAFKAVVFAAQMLCYTQN